MMFNTSITETKLGNGLNVSLSQGNMTVKAESHNNTRLLGGAVSISSATAGVGLNVATFGCEGSG